MISSTLVACCRGGPNRRQAGRFESRSRVSTWLLAIARNEAPSVLRRRIEELDEEGADMSSSRIPWTIPKSRCRRRSAILQDWLTQLSPAHRQSSTLVY